MKFTVGYTADQRGREVVRLAQFLAQGTKTELDLVMVAPQPSALQSALPGEVDYQNVVSQQINEWAGEVLASLPEDTDAQVVVVGARSEAQGLLRVSIDTDSAVIVVGADARGLKDRFTIGSTANALLHASQVPVAMAPHGFSGHGEMTRVSAFVGALKGARAVVDTAAATAGRRGIPLRLISLLPVDSRKQTTADIEAARRRSDELLRSLVEPLNVETETVSATGKDIEDAVESLDWQPTEIAIVGSSRLATRGKLFMGSTAHRILRELPVPLVAVPRSYRTRAGESADAPPRSTE